MKILIASPDAQVRHSIDHCIEPQEVELLQAHSGEEAWRLLLDEPVRVLVVDQRVPEMAGLELCRRVRRAREIAADVRESDEVYRFGGEEIILVLPEQRAGTA